MFTGPISRQDVPFFAVEDGLYVVQSLPVGSDLPTTTVAGVTKKATRSRKVKAVVASGKGKKQYNTLFINSLIKGRGQSHGKKVVKLPNTGRTVVLGRRGGVTHRESNTVRDLTINRMASGYKNTNINSRSLSGLLAFLLRGRSSQQRSSSCAPEDVYVNYVYEYDIQNQVFNSSFQDANSAVVQQLQSTIADWSAEEIYKRNLVSYVTDDARLIKIIDVSKQYDNRATLRFYVSINVSKNLIPVIRRVLSSVFERLQKERFATSNKKIDWGNMVLIPISK